jgi:YD repeat-containing protein
MKVYHSTTTDNNPVKQVTYGYNAGGNRISKRVVKTGTKTVNWTWYVRDALGSLMLFSLVSAFLTLLSITSCCLISGYFADF